MIRPRPVVTRGFVFICALSVAVVTFVPAVWAEDPKGKSAETKDPLAEIKAQLAATQAQMAEMKAQLTETQAQLAETKSQLEGTKARPAEKKAKASEVKAKPAEVKAKPAEVKPKPVEVKAKPAEVKPKPVEVKAKPAEVKPKPVEVKAKPAGVKPKPVEVKAKPAEVKPKPAEVKAKPAEVKPKPVEVKAKPAEVKPKPAEVKTPAAKSAAAVPEPADKLPWWPTDAQPGPVKDDSRGGYWWWPSEPGKVKDLWGNRGYAYVKKIIYNWHGSGVSKYVQVTVDGVSGIKTDMRPSLIIKRTIRDLKLPFSGSQIELGPDHSPVLNKALASLKHNDLASILITSDPPPDDTVARLLGERRAAAVERFMLDNGIEQARIMVVAPGKFQEAGLRSAKETSADALQILVAEVAEILIPGPEK